MRGAGDTQFILKQYHRLFFYIRAWILQTEMSFCWQVLSQIPSAEVALITAGPLVKAVTNYKQVCVAIIFIYTEHVEQIPEII